MTPDPSLRFYVIAALIVLACLSVFALYARAITCRWCYGSWAVFPRAVGDLCRSCSSVFDRHRIRIGRRRSLLQRIRRAAA